MRDDENEIIKALERMSEEDPNGFSSNILDLINRKNAEIERLKDIARSALKESINICDSIFEAKSEARKEFAERLKKKAASRTYCTIFESDVDDLLAEMEERE